jgi:hypothetical protein
MHNPNGLFIILRGPCLLFIEFPIGYAQEGGLIQVRELTFPPTPTALKSEALFSSQKFTRFLVTSNLAAHAWSIKYT